MIDPRFAVTLVERYGTPLYAYDLTEVEHQAEKLRSSLPPATLLYSVKANPLPVVGSALERAGFGVEVSSIGELRIAREANFAPARILLSGPGKTEKELQFAVEQNVSNFSIESWTDLGRLESVLQARRKTASAILRINPNLGPISKLAMTGRQGQFGFAEDILARQSDVLSAKCNRVSIVGLHIYQGTQILGTRALLESFGVAMNTANRIAEALDISCKVLNLGGGFAWPFGTDAEPEDLADLKQPLAKILSQYEQAQPEEYCFESGRFLTASSGTLLARVLDVKSIEGKKYIVLDAGINNLGGMAGLGRVFRSKISFLPLIRSDSEQTETVDVVGPLCTPLDVIAQRVEFPVSTPGDIILIPNVGAYGLSASLLTFLSREAPIEVAYRGGCSHHAYRLNYGHEAIEENS